MNMKETKLGVYTHNDETHNFNFTTNLTAHEKRVFVRTVVETLVGDTYYDSVLRDIIFDYTAILMLTDIDMSFLRTIDEDDEEITDIELLEDFLLETNIIEVVKANAFPTLFDELNNAVDKSIEYRTGIHPSPLSDALASLFSTLEKKVSEIDLGSAMSMAQKFAGMTGELTPESLINAYMNSDIHKNNVVEIEKEKKSNKGKKTKNNKKNEIKLDEDLGEAIRAIVKENKSENDSKNDSEK